MSTNIFVIKEHKVDPFEPHPRDAFFIGYITNFDEHSLAYKLSKSIFDAHKFELSDCALALSKLNKLNMRFYEICLYDGE